eukprot:3536976-Amphidinium_carterae.1
MRGLCSLGALEALEPELRKNALQQTQASIAVLILWRSRIAWEWKEATGTRSTGQHIASSSVHPVQGSAATTPHATAAEQHLAEGWVLWGVRTA